MAEKSESEGDEERQRLADRVLSRLEDAVYWGIAVVLIVGCAAVRACLRSHEIVAEPFLIVGILAGIKEIVVLSVEAATLLEKGPAFSRAVVEIGVLAGVVLALALAAFVLRERRRDTVDVGEDCDEDEAEPVKS